MKITILGAHDIDSSASRCVSLLIDGKVAIDAGGLTSGLSLEAQRQVKAIFLTHQHYDHIRDIPGIALNFRHSGESFNLFAPRPVYDALLSHFFDGVIYPKFLETPAGNPTVKFTIVDDARPVVVEGYQVLLVPVKHAVPSVGYMVTSPDGKALFFTGDTGPGLGEVWQKVTPGLLIIECTLSNRHASRAIEPKHLTPDSLGEELLMFRRLKGYLPRVVVIHMEPEDEAEIRVELEWLSGEIGHPIAIASEGMQIEL
jgi:ribonuclease BN (tRNA processing enzyme)